MRPSPGWAERAACRGSRPEHWVREDRTTLTHTDEGRQTLEVCAGCPVRTECLEAALATPERHDHGVWGGTTARERKRIRRQRRKTAAV